LFKSASGRSSTAATERNDPRLHRSARTDSIHTLCEKVDASSDRFLFAFWSALSSSLLWDLDLQRRRAGEGNLLHETDKAGFGLSQRA
jgi:hypothetical protein